MSKNIQGPFLVNSFSNFKYLYFKKLRMDFNNLKAHNLISMYIL